MEKVSYYITLKDWPVFCLPGLYNEFQKAFLLVTREANSVMKGIHNGSDNAGRMPLFLPKELELKWIQDSLKDEVHKLQFNLTATNNFDNF